MILTLLALVGCAHLSIDKSTIEIVSLSHHSPTRLKSQERVLVTVKYSTDYSRKFLIFARPYYKGKLTLAYVAHPSREYKKGRGVVDGYFFFECGAIKVDRVVATMVDSESGVIIAKADRAVDYELECQ